MALKSKLPERYPDIIAMYAKGHANSQDILKADFAQWPPKGLDIVDAPDIDIKFKSIFKTWPGLSRFLPSFTSLYLMSAFFKSYPVTTIALTTLSTAAKVMSLGGFVRRGDPTIHLNDTYRLFGKTLGGRRFLSHILSHEFQHIVQGRDAAESLSSSFDGDRLGIKEMLIKDASKSQHYHAEECEIQARLHTVMVGAYHQFEVMPTSYEELIAALYSQGVKLPNVVVRDVRETGKGQAAFDLFKPDQELLDRYADKSAVRDLSGMLQSINPWKRKIFCQETLAFIYGDYLELLGDQQGLKRMGHGHNVQLREVFYRSAKDFKLERKKIAQQDVTTPEEIAKMKGHFDRALDVVGKMDRQDAVGLGCKIIQSDIYLEYGKSAECVTPARGGIGEAALKLIWSREDLTSHDRQKMIDAKNHYTDAAIRRIQTKAGLSDVSSRPEDDGPKGHGGRNARRYEIAA